MEVLFGGDEPAMSSGQARARFRAGSARRGSAKLADHKGKDVVDLDFWATWCGPCVQGLPIVSEVARGYAGKGVVFYAVNEQEDAATIEPFLKEHKLDIKVALDKEGAAGNSFGVQGIPQTVIIGKDGVIKVIHVGFSPNLKTQLTRELDNILAEKDDPPPGCGRAAAKAVTRNLVAESRRSLR